MFNSCLFKISETENHICELLSESPPERYPSEDRRYQTMLEDSQLWTVANRNELDCMLAHKFCDLLPERSVPSRWTAAHDNVQQYMSERFAALQMLSEQLVHEGVTIALLKNGGIARGIYSCLGCCPMGDIDILVDVQEFTRAHDIIKDNGFEFHYRNHSESDSLEHALVHGGAEYWKPLSADNILWLELQWRTVAGRWIQPSQEPSATRLLKRSTIIPGTSMRLLAPEDNLLQVSLHTAKHSYVRAPGFRLHLDVDRIVRAYPELDWQVFLAQVESLRLKTAVYFSLVIPHVLLNTPIPCWVLDRLRPPRWKEAYIVNWLNRVGLFWSSGNKFSLPGYYLFAFLLYDDTGDVVRLAVPDKCTVRSRYQQKQSQPLWRLYSQHWTDLFLRRRTI